MEREEATVYEHYINTFVVVVRQTNSIHIEEVPDNDLQNKI